MKYEYPEKRFTVEAGLRKLGNKWCVWFYDVEGLYVCGRTMDRQTSDFWEDAQFGKRPAEAISKVIDALERAKEKSVD